MKDNRNIIQLLTAAVLALGGLVLLFVGASIAPAGEIHQSLLIGFGEVATFSGALFGIDAAYTMKLWDIINSTDKRHKAKPSAEHSTTANPEDSTNPS